MSIRINRKLFYILVLIFAILVVRILEIKYDVEPEIENVGTIENGIVDGGSKCTFTFGENGQWDIEMHCMGTLMSGEICIYLIDGYTRDFRSPSEDKIIETYTINEEGVFDITIPVGFAGADNRKTIYIDYGSDVNACRCVWEAKSKRKVWQDVIDFLKIR